MAKDLPLTVHLPVSTQLWRLAVIFLLGIFCNILFQMYTALRSVISPSRFSAHTLDGVVAFFVLVVIACVVFMANYGELRLYIVISLGSGFILSNVLVGNLVYASTRSVLNATAKFLALLGRGATAATNKLKHKVWIPVMLKLKKPRPPGNDKN